MVLVILLSALRIGLRHRLVRRPRSAQLRPGAGDRGDGAGDPAHCRRVLLVVAGGLVQEPAHSARRLVIAGWAKPLPRPGVSPVVPWSIALAPRPYWKGYLKLSLVPCQVSLPDRKRNPLNSS